MHNDGEVKAIVFDGPADYTFTWSNGTVQGPTPMKNVTLSNLAAGTYTVTVTDDNGCTTSATEVVKDGIPFMIIPIADLGPVCPNTPLGPIVLQTNIWGADFTWTGWCQRWPRQRQRNGRGEPDHPDLQRLWRSNGDGESDDGPLQCSGNLHDCGLDIVAPKFANCPTTPVMEMADPNTCASKVNWAAPVATDNCGMVNTIQTGGPASGTAIPVGSHTIVYTTSDMAGNTAICSFQVMVMDEVLN